MRTYLANVLVGTIVIVFALDLVLPVFLASLVRTDEATAVGRIGFLGPVLIIADSETRRSLLAAASGAISAAMITCVLGTVLGLATSGKGGVVFRTSRFLAFLPGRMPAWVIPACLAASTAGELSETLQELGLFAWVFWAALWGAMRLASAFHETVSSVPLVEWDATRNLGLSSVAAFRAVLAPRLSEEYNRIAKQVALVTLFDPAPVLFLGVRRWPIGEVLGLLRQGEVRYAVEAASWILWLFLISAAVGSILRLVFGSRFRFAKSGHRTTGFASAENDVSAIPAMTWTRVFAYIGALPVLILAVSLAKGLSLLRISEAGLTGVSHRFVHDGLVSTTLLNGLVFAVSTAIFIEVISRIGDIRRAAGIMIQLESWWSLELAICAIAIGGICSTRLEYWVFPNREGFASTPFWPISLAVFVIARTRFPIDWRVDSKSPRTLPGHGTKSAAFDSAVTLGLGRSRAQVLSGRADRLRSRAIDRFRLILSGWWIWITPAWAFVPLWRVASVPVGGQVLVDRLRTNPGGLSFGETSFFMMAIAVVLSLAGLLTRSVPDFRRTSSA